MSITGYQSMDLYQLLANWQQIGFFDIVLPFLLIFAISFAVLQKVGIFGPTAKNINVIVSLVISFLFLQNTYLIFILQRFLPNVAIILVVILLFMLVLGVWGFRTEVSGKYMTYAFWISVIVILMALLTDFAPGVPVLGPLLYFIQNSIPISPGLIGIIIVIIAVIALTRCEKKSEDGKPK